MLRLGQREGTTLACHAVKGSELALTKRRKGCLESHLSGAICSDPGLPILPLPRANSINSTTEGLK